jgi:glycosyltransferase involved in cell wall biosynthesis
MKLAIVADWLTNYGGAENVISAMHEAYPEAPIYTTLFNPKKMKDLNEAQIITSYLQKIPGAKLDHKPWLSMMPHAIERFDLNQYDVVLSSAHSIAKGVITKPKTLHLCYCHNPMRYCWDNWQEYIKQWGLPNFLNKIIYKKLHQLRLWDRLAADRVDYYLANSHFVAGRIKKYYKKEAEVLHPPVNISNYSIIDHPTTNYFFAAGRLVPFKRFDLIVETFNELGLPLKIAGSGPELKRLTKMAKPNVVILGFVSDQELQKLYQNCTAFIFAHVEDAGITPLEAMACGRPVIALKQGGAAETVIENQTGLFFEKQTVHDLKQVIQNFNPQKFNPQNIRKHSLPYQRSEYIRKLKSIVNREWGKWKNVIFSPPRFPAE